MIELVYESLVGDNKIYQTELNVGDTTKYTL